MLIEFLFKLNNISWFELRQINHILNELFYWKKVQFNNDLSMISQAFCRFMFLFTIFCCLFLPAGNLFGQETATPKEILTGMTAEDKLLLIRKHAFINDAMADLVGISEDEMIFNKGKSAFFPLFFDPDTLGVPAQHYEEHAERLIRNYMDVPPTLSLNGIIHAIAEAIKSSRRNAVLADPPEPTKDEIAVLRVVWEHSIATSSDIYTSLDSATLSKYTSEDIQKLLNRMTDRGFLERKQISPAREFTFFGIAKIEMSAQNRRNKLYIYWPVISKERIIALLDTRRFQMLAEKETGNDTEAYASQKLLEEKLLQLVR
jgi:hypothetical protein